MKLVREHGLSVEDAALALGLDVDTANLAVQADRGEKLNINDMVDSFKPRAIEILQNIAEDPDTEARDKIAACKILLQGEGIMPEINANDLSERIKRMRIAAGRVIDITPQLAMAS